MKVRVIASFDAYPVGAVFDWDAGFAHILALRGLVEEIKEEDAEKEMISRGLVEEVEQADIPQADGVERAEVGIKRRRK